MSDLNFEAMPNKLVNYATLDGIAVIELASDAAGAALTETNDRSPNTYTHEMMSDLDDAIIKARFDDDVSCIVLTGNGSSFFSAGASIQMLNSVSPGFKYNFCLHANETLSRLEQTSKLVVCAINGHAVGGGLEIAMAADIRIARKNSGKVGLPEINLGVLAGTGGTARLTRLIGKAKALEMMVTGELMSFEDAHAHNLINHIWEGDAADIRIARKNSGKVGLPEINLGVLAGTGGTARLTRLIGKAKALEMMVTGELMSFEDAHAHNLINHIWEGDAADFRRDILDWCSQFTLPNKATKAVGNIKRSCQTGPEIPFEYHLALERELQAALFNSSDAKEGIAAYVEKRVANFTGE